MNRCKQTKFSQVAENLHKEVQTHTKSNEEKPLPSVRTLAVRLQTSTKTVIQALQLFVENGILHQAPVNGRYYLAHIKPSSYSNQPGISEQNTENGIVDRIKNELLMRPRTKHEAIPSFTQLRKTYRCSHKKVREALKSLEKQGFLKPEGRSFKLNTPAQDSTCQSRIYIAGLPRFLYQFPFTDIFREIEMVLESHGWREPGYLLKDQKTSSPIPPDHHIAGFITLYHALSEKNGLVMHRLKPLIPQVIIDPGETLADEGVGCKFFRKIWPDNAYAGRALGMHLRAAGHQRIAFITHMPESTNWVALRIKGLQTVFSGSNPSGGSPMHIFTAKKQQRWHDELQKNAHLVIRNSLAQFQNIAKKMHLPAGDFIHANTTRPLSTLMSLASLSQVLHPVFETVLHDHSITAWVCVNDDAATLAYEYLKCSALSAARKISVAGFDNLPLSRMTGLTSFDFAHEAMGRAATNAFLFPSSSNAKNTIRVRGNMIVRDSSRLH